VPQLNNWMLFVGGENFTICGASIAASQSLKLTEGQFYSRDKFLWMPGVHAAGKIYRSCQLVAASAVRAHYYTSVCGDQPAILEVRSSLWSLGFTPVAFKKPKRSRDSKIFLAVAFSLSRKLMRYIRAYSKPPGPSNGNTPMSAAESCHANELAATGH
jgi:hypothetical protein